METDIRIISLLPAATEIVCALGLQKNLIGRSHECDYPPGVETLPVCSRANLAIGLSSKEIDARVKELLTDALSIYIIDKELIKELKPDAIITQAQCEVCAVSLDDVQQALGNYLEKSMRIISLQPQNLNDILADIIHVANDLRIPEAGEVLADDLQERMDIIRHKLKFIDKKPKVACIEWLEPLMVSGNWIPEMVDIAGGIPVLSKQGEHSHYVNWEDIIFTDPDIIVVMPCGFSIKQTIKEIDILLSQPGFNDLSAVKSNRLYIADGNQYFNRPGPRIVDSVEILAEIINPKQFVFGYEGDGWIKFEV